MLVPGDTLLSTNILYIYQAHLLLRSEYFLTEKHHTGERVFAGGNFFVGDQTVGAVSRQVDFLEVERLLCKSHTRTKTV